MRTIALKLAYDGTKFHGSQWQPAARTIQGEVETAWMRLTQEQQRFLFAGRTDAGVHAQGQVAHVRTDTHHSAETIQRALNALLPDDIAVLQSWEATPDFHARYSAEWRWYRYLLSMEPVLLPQLRWYVLRAGGVLDVAAMHAALIPFHGRHDFAAFTTEKHPGPTERVCYQATCHEVDWQGVSLVAIDLVANGFLQHMVRIVVGTLLLVGRGKMAIGEFERILNEQDRQGTGATVAAHGLTLMAVGYSEDRT
jgi:tRNA pseudouridine38-40 synthase